MTDKNVSLASLQTLHQMISENPFVISPTKVKQITLHLGIDIQELLTRLVPIAASYARPTISNYKVGVAVLANSGAIYLGVNLEFPGMPLNESVHAEQFAISNAKRHDESGLVAIALSAAPCGHCRQFMSEMGCNDDFQVLIPHTPPTTLSSLLPKSFGPHDLGLSVTLFSSQRYASHRDINEKSDLINHATDAALASYAPYTEAKSGIAIQTNDGKIYTGSYIENSAYNPSLSPLQSALVALVADRHDYNEITKVALVEQQNAKISQKIMSKTIIHAIAPNASFHLENR